MQTRGSYLFYSDVITVMKNRRAGGIWWARGRAVPRLPVLVHAVALRASGIADLAIGERIGAEVVWGPSGAEAYRLRRIAQPRTTRARCEAMDRLMQQLRRR
jgi:hypothetical protein